MQLPGLSDLTPLGQGGFATVYRARQVQLNREVAVKIDNRVLQTERDRRRFLREAHAAARLSGHPHVVSVHDANFTPQGTPYLVMELCTGGSLADVIRRDGPLSADRVRQYGVQLADALAAAHAEGVLHRDIKPGNILLDRYGTAKLADFGLAALLDAEGSSTVTRDALSPSYAPPEAFAMAQPTPAADVYALAATLYDLLAGRPPRPVPWPVESFDHLGDVLRSPVPAVRGVPQELHDTLVRALEPDVARRTPSAVQFRDELSRIVMTTVAGPTVPVVGAVGGPAAGAMSGPDAVGGSAASAVAGSGAVSGPNVASWPGAGVNAGPGMTPGQPQVGAGPQFNGPQYSGPQNSGPQYAGPQYSGPYGAGYVRPPTKKPWALVIGAAVLATVVAIGTWWWATRSPDTTTSPGGQTTTSTTGKTLPPPHLKECATGYCVAEPTCYRGITSIGGLASTARRVGDCSEEHYWEAFAGGWLSGPVPKVDSDELVRAPEVASVCTAEVMKANTRPAVDTSTWEFTAVGFEDGEETYFHCLASPTEGGELTTSAFGGS
ncbi:serine/threonine protein kinase [Saccharothrix sp. ALI-22-I]|uniref:serine/threonine-protein kinase n=1 Tax=Saccharothrix sp. ALI-22-I TaxID=1933778 RepID=UPI00097C2D9D|nr:serine/threonine-protein kinase [Saccharothrix sp. ALI-22-I]ONI83842.1 serine/threonine protein kinase [Saccharothrix sp. ALI-22-I]